MQKKSQSAVSTWITRYCCSKTAGQILANVLSQLLAEDVIAKGEWGMNLKGKRIGFGLRVHIVRTEEVMPHLEKLIAEGAEVRPVVSYTVQSTNTRFGRRGRMD